MGDPFSVTVGQDGRWRRDVFVDFCEVVIEVGLNYEIASKG
jgi:hypothetical protein